MPARAAEELERQVTARVEIAVNGTPHFEHLRSVLVFGHARRDADLPATNRQQWDRPTMGPANDGTGQRWDRPTMGPANDWNIIAALILPGNSGYLLFAGDRCLAVGLRWPAGNRDKRPGLTLQSRRLYLAQAFIPRELPRGMVELVTQIFAVRKESALQVGDKPLIRSKWQLIPSDGLRIASYPTECG